MFKPGGQVGVKVLTGILLLLAYCQKWCCIKFQHRPHYSKLHHTTLHPHHTTSYTPKYAWYTHYTSTNYIPNTNFISHHTSPYTALKYTWTPHTTPHCLEHTNPHHITPLHHLRVFIHPIQFSRYPWTSHLLNHFPTPTQLQSHNTTLHCLSLTAHPKPCTTPRHTGAIY